MDHGAAEWRESIYYQDDHEQHSRKFPVYYALYAYCGR